MKPNIHPEYREVAFLDVSVNKTFIISSAVQTKETIEIDGKTYPLFKLDTSSASHPFYGSRREVPCQVCCQEQGIERGCGCQEDEELTSSSP